MLTQYFLFQRSRLVRDLFYDLRDGTSLLALLEVLSGERLVSSSVRPFPAYVLRVICLES